VVAASYTASRVCRSCSEEAAERSSAADALRTAAAPCFRLGAGSACRNTKLTLVLTLTQTNNVKHWATSNAAFRLSYPGSATIGND
jgi:hypothetical protein